MNQRTITATARRGNASGTVVTILAVLALAAAVWFGLSGDTSDATTGAGTAAESAADPLMAERIANYNKAVEAGAKDLNWPADEKAVITAFWKAANQHDYDRLMTLCPGSRAEDYKAYYDKWTPGEATAVGTPEPHPTAAGIQVWPVTVPFPGFPRKTVKMALYRLPDGRFAIDGEHTIWW